MIGSKKQIKWAEDVKERVLNCEIDLDALSRFIKDKYSDNDFRSGETGVAIVCVSKCQTDEERFKIMDEAEDESSDIYQRAKQYFESFNLIEQIESIEDAKFWIEYSFDGSSMDDLFAIIFAIMCHGLLKATIGKTKIARSAYSLQYDYFHLFQNLTQLQIDYDEYLKM